MNKRSSKTRLVFYEDTRKDKTINTYFVIPIVVIIDITMSLKM